MEKELWDWLVVAGLGCVLEVGGYGGCGSKMAGAGLHA